MRLLLNGFAIVLCLASPAVASELRYAPLNPSFGGSPFNSSHFLSRASAQNTHERPTTTQSDAETFARTLQSAIVNQAAFSIANTIFKPAPGSFGVRQTAYEGTATRIDYMQNADGTVTTYIVDKINNTETSFKGNQTTN